MENEDDLDLESILKNTNKSIFEDIQKFIISFSEEDINLNEFVDFVYIHLLPVYETKLIYKEFIKQLICFSIERFRFKFPFKYRPRNNKVQYLQTIPQYIQRTAEWYRSKKFTIGASENASVFNMNPYSSRNALLLKKLGVEEVKSKNFHTFTQHGIRYEPILKMVYEKRYNTYLFEFGSIIHKKYDFISASPDGITEDGIMVEFKAPKSRLPNGIPPCYYWTQMQQQLQVCGLDKCDFVECVIHEYDDYDEFKDDTLKPGISKYSHNEQGIIMEFIKNGESVYEYLDIGLNEDDFIKIQAYKKKIHKDKIFCKNIYWFIDEWSNIPVWRDDDWWYKYALIELIKFWREVLERRINGFSDLIKEKKPRPPKDLRDGDEIINDKCLIDFD